MDIRAELRELMDSHNYSTAFVANATGLAKSTISMWLNGNYNGKNDKITDAMNNFIQREKERSVENDLPFVDISIVKYVSEIGRLCHTQGKIGVCVGRAGLGKTVAVKKYTKDFQDSILIESDSGYTKEYPSYEEYYIFLSRSGEFYLLMHHFAEWLQNNKSSNFLLVFTAKYHLNICKMFFPNIPMTYIKKANVQLISRGVENISFKYKNKKFYVPTYENYFVDVENKIRDKNAHYYECLKKHLKFNNNIQHYNISIKTQEKIKNIVKNILNNKFIFISPETLSNEPMEKDFWDNLCEKLKNQGYEVFCNSMDFKNLIKDSTSTFLTYEEAIELAKYATAIIGLRSGFLECLSQNNVPLIALYTDFPKRPGFKKLSSDKVKSGYSISKLPNVNKNLLY